MTQSEQAAREIGDISLHVVGEPFVEACRAIIQRAVDGAVAEERERCAAIARKRMQTDRLWGMSRDYSAEEIADEISWGE